MEQATWIIAIATVGAMTAAIYYAYVTREMQQQSLEMFQLLNKPVIDLTTITFTEENLVFAFSFRNHGNTVAKELKVHVLFFYGEDDKVERTVELRDLPQNAVREVLMDIDRAHYLAISRADKFLNVTITFTFTTTTGQKENQEFKASFNPDPYPDSWGFHIL